MTPSGRVRARTNLRPCALSREARRAPERPDPGRAGALLVGTGLRAAPPHGDGRGTQRKRRGSGRWLPQQRGRGLTWIASMAAVACGPWSKVPATWATAGTVQDPGHLPGVLEVCGHALHVQAFQGRCRRGRAHQGGPPNR